MKRICYLLLILLVGVLLVGCSEPAVDSNNIGESSGGGNDGIVVDTTRKIYYTVEMNIESNNVEETYKYYTTKVYASEGYVSSSAINSTGSSSVIYKVPTSKLAEFLDYIEESDKGAVVRKTISTTDITSKYNAVEAKLEVLKASRESYLKMLENASNLSEIISLRNKIEEIDTEISRLEHEKGSYDAILEYSTVTIYFNQKIKNSFFGDYFDYFVEFFKVIGIIILYTIPFGIVAGVVLLSILVPIKIKKLRGKNEKEKNI